MARAHVNAEFKARCTDLNAAARRAREAGARRVTRVRQIDTYFAVSGGRLKLRESGDRAQLVWYFRADTLRSKRSDVLLMPVAEASGAKNLLARQFGVRVVVDKVRRVYLKQNVRVHLDQVRGLGAFVEIEAVGEPREFPRLKRQAEEMASALGLSSDDLVGGSYSDLLLAKRGRARG
jgi:adenylate cyclase, class 2